MVNNNLILEMSYFLLLLCVLGFAMGSQKALVILDNLDIKETHSLIFSSLEQRGISLDFRSADDSSLALNAYGEYLYSHLILFIPSTGELGSGLTSEAVIEFIDDGGNVFMAGSSNTGDFIRDVASECGFDIDEEGAYVIDHLHHDVNDEGHHNLVVAEPENLVKSERIVGKDNKFPFIYRGAGIITDNENPLVIDILTGSSTSYSHNPSEMVSEYPHAIGKNTVLIGGLQARNNARVVFSGSLDFFSDEFYTSQVERVGMSKKSSSGNAMLAKSLTDWCFQQTGVVRIDNVSHKHPEEETTPQFYTINDMCQFQVVMSELVSGEWVPYQGNDVQMEFVMIDPFERKTLENKNGRLNATFKIPDVYGVFKFVVSYNRLGLTSIFTSTQVSVHPLRHDSYERFILTAYPYYASSFSMMASLVLFSFVFLHFKEDKMEKNKAE